MINRHYSQDKTVMSNEQHQVLHMLQEGRITPEEAEKLLTALEESSDPDEITGDPVPGAAPEMQHFRRYWEVPFFTGLILAGVAGLCVSNTSNTLILLCGWGVLITAGLIGVIGWFSQWSSWVHVRIREQDGRRIALSLPLPVQLIAPLLRVARPMVQRFADSETAENLDMAASLLDMMDDISADEPVTIEVQDEDGDHIRVFFG